MLPLEKDFYTNLCLHLYNRTWPAQPVQPRLSEDFQRMRQAGAQGIPSAQTTVQIYPALPAHMLETLPEAIITDT